MDKKEEIERYILRCKHENFDISKAVNIIYDLFQNDEGIGSVEYQLPSEHVLDAYRYITGNENESVINDTESRNENGMDQR